MGTAVLQALRGRSVSSNVRVLKGRRAILEQSSLLESLALRCGQPGAMNWLGYFLDAPESRRKSPYLVMLMKPEAGGSPQADAVHAAVLLFEYCVMGCRTGAFTTGDMTGFRTVIAPDGERGKVAAIAVNAVMQCGAHQVMLSYANAEGVASLQSGYDIEWAQRRRVSDKTLVLEDNFDSTLARLGKGTRRNLRYYRKRLLEWAPCEFIPDARGQVSEPELMALNARSLNPVPSAKLLLQHASACDLAGSFLMGIRTEQGEWLSLAGGWRQGGLTVLHWQMNAAGYEKASLCTVMRSLLIEHEVARRTQRIVFYGGTTHPMRLAFEQEPVHDLVVRRRSVRGALLRLAARATRTGANGQANFFARTFAGEDLEWHRQTPARRVNDRPTPRGIGLAEQPSEAFPRQD